MPFYLNDRWHRRTPGEQEARRLGFRLGLGVFTTIGVRHGSPVFLTQHLHRLEASARLLHLELPAPDTLRTLILEGLRRNGPASGVIKVMVAHATADRGRKASAPRIAVLVMPGRPAPGAVDLLVSPLIPTRWHAHKLTAYLDSAMLAGRARAAGCFDALAVANGALLDTSIANIFRIDRAGIHTPPADGRILPGIARRTLLAARDLGIRERPLLLRDLDSARSLFLTNSVRGIVPVGRVLDGRAKVVWKPAGGGDVLAAVRGAYEREVRRDLGGLE